MASRYLSSLLKLHDKQERIRNICIMAHVDHGKTTLSDHLIASNGFIHPKLVGELRFLDYKEDEQARGITMKSSSITLLYPPPATVKEDLSDAYLVNLIDSPGHVDFCSEVSTAARLSDGALVLVDAVEGVCIQTQAVLRQAWEEKVKPCLMVNKIDRLVLELRLTPLEAYQRIQQILTHVNMIWSSFQSEKFISDADAILAYEDAKEAAAAREEAGGGGEQEEEDEEEDHEQDAFQPALGNVAFGSAIDGWAFRVDQFAAMYAQKLGAKPDALRRALWGDYHYAAKERRVVRIRHKGAAQKTKPMFVQFALEPIWKAYTVCDGAAAADVLQPIVRGMKLDVAERVLQQDPRLALKAVLKAWLPLSEAVLHMVAHHLPCPTAAAPLRVPHLLGVHSVVHPQDGRSREARVHQALVESSSASSAPVVVYVSKMVAVPVSQLPRNPNRSHPMPANGSQECFLAFGRVFSGVVTEGQRLHVLSALYDPTRPDQHRQSVVVTGLYMMMGRALEQLPAVPAGNVLAIAGLDTAILKSATLSSTPFCPPLAPMTFQAAPIVKVAVEPVLPGDMPRLVEGLRLLNRADPFVEVGLMDTGEHVLGAAGEVHLETCIKDLRERFAGVQLQVSPPLVAFKETVSHPDEVQDGSAPPRPPRVVEITTPNGVCTLRVRAHPLPAALAHALDDNQDVLRALLGASGAEASGSGRPAGEGSAGSGAQGQTAPVQQLRSQLQQLLEEHPRAAQLLKRAWLLGPRFTGANLLLPSGTPPGDLFSIPPAQVAVVSKHQHLGQHDTNSTAGAQERQEASEAGSSGSSSTSTVDLRLGSNAAAAALLDDSWATSTSGQEQQPAGLEALQGSITSGVVSGFQLAAAAGPLCDEPLWGVAFELGVRLQLPSSSAQGEEDGTGSSSSSSGRSIDLQEDVYGPFSGQVMTAATAACRRAVMEAEPRVVEALYLCSIQASSQALAGVYAVLGRRRARILRESMRDGSDYFTVHSHLPVEASFGLADELRRRCSGAASASLILSHWERLQVDPFFVPTTEDEREEHGEDAANLVNLAKKLVDMVRRRKGLPVEEKKVEKATKQRTLKRNV